MPKKYKLRSKGGKHDHKAIKAKLPHTDLTSKPRGVIVRGKQKYNHKQVESHWQDVWLKDAVYYPQNMLDIPADKKYYNLFMFPYPSAEGLHAGHAFASTGSDIYGKYMRMRGKSVFQPIGYDSFGIHSENFALKINEQPGKMLERTTKHYEKQLKSLGHGYDWTRTVTTSDVDYYKWTQWLFIQMFKAGLAYRKKATVNWCPKDKTVLADEQVMTPKQAGKEARDASGNIIEDAENVLICERCGTVAEKKELEQWFFRITTYAEKLLGNLNKIDWPEKIKIAQRNWIGKKEGITITYPIKDSKETVKVWTSRPDTNFGATFIVVSPEHPKAMQLTIEKHYQEVSEYIKISQSKSREERIAEGREKSGVFTGSYAVNQLNGAEMPIWVADFVLMEVGTGAVVGVPGHDERDYAFARKFNLPIKKVVDYDGETHSVVIKKSVSENFLEEVEKNKWYWTDYEGWGYGLVIPKGDEDKYINLIQSSLKEEAWYVHTDGSLKAVIFKDKYFNIETENEKAKEHARKIEVPEAQIDWDKEDSYMFCYTGEGRMVNSDFLNDLHSLEAINRVTDYLEDKGWGKREVNYHLRDWLISRQRYWGPPIPMIYCEKCAGEGKSWFNSSLKDKLQSAKFIHTDHSDWEHAGWYPDENLPVKLPYMEDYKPEGAGRGPLAKLPEFVKSTCPACGEVAKRETDVSDTFLDSSWYFLRYPSVKYESASKIPFDKDITRKWLPVDLYFGGAEHAVLHLMYSRFVTMVLNDLSYLTFEEPFPRFFAHGLMIKDGAKMSKSRGNVVNPDEYIEKFGADTLRLYLMFMGPMDGYPDFRDTGIEGMKRFVDRLWELFNFGEPELDKEDNSQLQTAMHKTIKRVTEDIEGFRYNTAISGIMEYINVLRSKTQKPQFKTQAESSKQEGGVWTETLKTLALLLAPFAPHMAEEVWQNWDFARTKVKGQRAKFESIHAHPWPDYDPQLIKEETVQIVIQVNGKLRGTLRLRSGQVVNKTEIIGLAKKEESVAKWLEGKEIKKEFYVPEKLVNFVV